MSNFFILIILFMMLFSFILGIIAVLSYQQTKAKYSRESKIKNNERKFDDYGFDVKKSR